MNPFDPFGAARKRRRQEKVRSSLGNISELSIPTLERKVQSLKSRLKQLESEQLSAVAKDKEKLIEGNRRLEQLKFRQERIKRIEEEIASIVADPASKRDRFNPWGLLAGSLYTKTLSGDASKRIHDLKVEKARLEGEILSASEAPLLELSRHSGGFSTIEDSHMFVARLQAFGSPGLPAFSKEFSGDFYQKRLREEIDNTKHAIESCVSAIKAKGERVSRLEAIAANVTGVTRQLAAKLAAQMTVAEICPYCGGETGDNPELDHIYPVSKGGLSVESNLVYICKVCNQKKGNRTLARFIKAGGFDRDAVEGRLRELGKEF